MAPHINCQAIRVPVTRSGVVEEGFLVFADDALMAVVLHLDQSVDDDDLRGLWFLETGYGPCASEPGSSVTFQSPEEAQAWVLERAQGTAQQPGSPVNTSGLRSAR